MLILRKWKGPCRLSKPLAGIQAKGPTRDINRFGVTKVQVATCFSSICMSEVAVLKPSGQIHLNLLSFRGIVSLWMVDFQLDQWTQHDLNSWQCSCKPLQQFQSRTGLRRRNRTVSKWSPKGTQNHSFVQCLFGPADQNTEMADQLKNQHHFGNQPWGFLGDGRLSNLHGKTPCWRLDSQLRVLMVLVCLHFLAVINSPFASHFTSLPLTGSQGGPRQGSHLIFFSQGRGDFSLS